MNITRVRCEHRENPLGIDEASPRLSWQFQPEGRGQRQTAYQVLVASSVERLAADEGDVWDSGRVTSERSIHVPYGGPALKSRQRCHWKVRTWDGDGQPGEWSAPAWWEMGLLKPADWKAPWIAVRGYPNGFPNAPRQPSPLLRGEFVVRKPVRAARVYVCGLGFFELHLNGRKVGDHVLDPLFTNYDKRALYVTHDVTSLLMSGRNAFGVMLGNGWYNGYTQDVWTFHAAPWRDRPKVRLQLEVVFEDGSTQRVVSGPEWRTSSGPLLMDALRNGETYDARLERPGWDAPGFDDANWPTAEVAPGPGGRLVAQTTPIKVQQTVPAVSVQEVKPGVFVFDMGQNLAGWAQLSVAGPAGTEVKLRYAEKLGPDGGIDTSGIDSFVKDSPFQTDTYILKGQGMETWEPRFTYHGFRWVEVTGFPGVPSADALRARVVHSAFDSAGEFECNQALLNTIQRCTRWSYISNFVGIPTDCPHREKNGWTGDALLAAETGLLNFGAASAYEKWLNDFDDALRESGQLPGIVPTGGWGYNWGSGPAWDSAYTHIPWYLYLYGGDLRPLETHYAGLKRYMSFMESMAIDDLLHFGLGDWCPPSGGPDGHKAPASLTSTGYYYANARILERAADLLGKPSESRRYGDLAERIRRAFNRAFFSVEHQHYAQGDQTSQGAALFHHLAGPLHEKAATEALVKAVEAANGHLDFGILGAKYVPNVLSERGRGDVVMRLFTQEDYPSYGLWLKQGATTLWETWDGGSSRNHIMFGDISAWMFRWLAGIQPDAARPGFAHTILRPTPVPGVDWVNASHQSPYGVVSSAWNRDGARAVFAVTVPPNTTATVWLPSASAEGVTESGEPLERVAGVTGVEVVDRTVRVAVASGTYRFEVAAIAGCAVA